MNEDGVPTRMRRLIRTAVLLGILPFLGGGAWAQGAGPGGNSATQSGTMTEAHSDKKVVQTGRWYLVRQFTVNFAVKGPNQTYCGEVTTTVINEVDDLMANKGKPVELLASGKDIDVTLQNGRRIRARQVAANKCEQN
jgi:hypothetical protein